MSLDTETLLSRFLADGLLLGALFSIVVVLSLLADPVVWLDDYPPDVRTMAPAELSGSVVVESATAGALLLLVAGGFWLAERRLERDLDRSLGFAGRFVYLWLLFQCVNVVDVVVVDWLIFTAWTPDFLVIPGTEGAAGYDDYLFHWRQSFLRSEPWVASLAVAALLAALTGWRSRG
ncbi:MAG: hypothetical protein R3244_02190 [Thermoanaerobaculia bacterium]|nr:hypothetical protein [Thermoanaerobaculia bacterium]